MEFSTLEARLATFEPPSKRSKLGWPHKTPTAEDLAKAGFYYKPLPTSNDNAMCYLCDRSLDGWEADDDPIQEHVTHSSDCGWAILMSLGQDTTTDVNTMEDPTGQLYVDARRATFSIGWPHESKRGWTCKIEKMVEAGWHYAPTTESDDFVSCIHCKLSLDGWEPKDNPFNEHYRRSPDCPFFHFAGTTAPIKRPRAKKGRASKSSRASKASTRLSTQSVNATVLSDAPSLNNIPDLDESIDTSGVSIQSVMSTASTATTKGKRKATGKPKATKAKRTKTTRATKAKRQQAELEETQEPQEQTIPEQSQSKQSEERPAAEVELEQAITIPPQSLPSPVTTPRVDVEYPSMPRSPGIGDIPTRLSPVEPPPGKSPTPARLGTRISPTRSAATPLRTSRSRIVVSPSSPSDIENAPPSSRPASIRPPPPQTVPVAFSSPGEPTTTWEPLDIEMLLEPSTPQPADLFALGGGTLSDKETNMTVQEWIEFVAGEAERGLRNEAERVVGVFEREGQRAMGVLEAIVCV
ncbi:uncharacterized protein A1O9_02359 [Exophiala aquamarina CBS 119918]|uniref:Baculoviral IAP repeat-containing 2/3/4 n=1 Tax=Exophiala aquamarina CBS 119918 TaxID=1182545 RepID=A0A072PM60_9EURO|nr:uncharacterized protein A1O9_02359 [Exophiala aquamarina CBS 119918]KEF60797.1 hypothetical protein A1O9_02359 [Exophiala aquamarina CBS 119918]